MLVEKRICQKTDNSFRMNSGHYKLKTARYSFNHLYICRITSALSEETILLG